MQKKEYLWYLTLRGTMMLLKNLPVLLLLISCSEFNNHIQDPSANTVEPILSVSGKTSIEQGRFTKLANIQKPKIALVWQEMDEAKISRFPVEVVSNVSPSFPFSFNSNLLENPPLYMNDPLNVFVGNVYLYSDGNKNGTLDALVHPDFQPYLDSLSFLKQIFINEKQKLLALSTITTSTPFQETHFQTEQNTVLFNTENGIDSSWATSLYSSYQVEQITKRRRQILQGLTKWETFLSKRANLVNTTYKFLHHKDHNLQITTGYYRRLYPISGNEALFEEQLKSATKAALDYYELSKWVRIQRISTQKNNYIYTPMDSKDWIAGMSIWNYVFYMFTQEELDEILAINQLVKSMGRTLITNPEQLSIGYNILSCTEDYYCSVLNSLDSVQIDLGDEACYIEGCQRELETLSARTPITLSDSILESYQGTYHSTDSSTTLTILFTEGNLWLFPTASTTFAIKPATRTIFFNSIYNTELEFVIDSTTNSIIYNNGTETLKLSKIESSMDTISANAVINTIQPTDIPILSSEILQQYSGKYILSDISDLSIVVKETHLKALFPGVGYLNLYPTSLDTFMHDESTLKIVFDRNEENTVTKLTYISPERTFTAPAKNYVTRNAAYFNYDINYISPILTQSQGTSIIESDILEQSYACLTDLTALSTDDPMLVPNASTAQENHLFGSPEDALIFSVTDSLSIIIFSFVGCPNENVDSTSMRIQVTGGTSLDAITDFIQDEHTVTFLKSGSQFAVNPIVINKKVPYYIKVTFSPLHSTESKIAIDSYFIQGS